MTAPPATHRSCDAAGCSFRIKADPADPDAAWNVVAAHNQHARGTTGSKAGYFASWHSTVDPPWEESAQQAAQADDRYWDRNTDNEEKE
ncbi:hypothetical protein ACFXI8_27235 [Streptomyces niveus]|uniref:hypothetical protein n=1 Tax=Streptomyces niveus TaxID=193462 RepID=UPI00369F93E7